MSEPMIMRINERICIPTHATLLIMRKYVSTYSHENVQPHSHKHTDTKGSIDIRRRHGYGPLVSGYRRLISMSVLTCTITSHCVNKNVVKTTTRIISRALHAELLIVGPIRLFCTVVCKGPSHNSTYQHV